MTTERLRPRDLLRDAEGTKRARRTTTRYLADRWTYRAVTVDAAYRWVVARDDWAVLPALTHRHEGVTWGGRVDLGRGLALKASRGPVIRFPTFAELFGQNGIQDGNPNLREERGLQWDAGFSWRGAGPFRCEVAYYESLTRDQIVLLQNSQRTVKAQNLERGWVRGAEASVYGSFVLPLAAALEVQGNGTSSLAEDVGRSRTYRGKRVPNLPLREGYLSTRLSWFGLDLRWEASARSSAYRDRYNSEAKKTPGYTVHDLSVKRGLFGRAFTVRAAVQNFRDARVMDLDGFPLPGRSYWMEATCTLD